MKIIAILCVATQLFSINGKAIDDLFSEPCTRTDPNLTHCVEDRLHKILSHLIKNGHPDSGIPKLDPFELPLIVFDVSPNNMTSLTGTYKNVRLIGIQQFIINDLQVDGKNLVLEVLITIPRIFATMEINVSGKVFNVPLRFDGDFTGEGTDIASRIKMRFDIVYKNGVKHLSFKKLKFKTVISGMHIDVAAKDPANQALVDVAITQINDNSEQVLQWVNPYFEEMAQTLFIPLMEQGLASLPFENLFL